MYDQRTHLYRPKSLILLLLALILSVRPGVLPVSAEAPDTTSFAASLPTMAAERTLTVGTLSFALPSALHRAEPLGDSAPPDALFVARSAKSSTGFPTFNVVRAAGSFPADPSNLTEISKSIAASYRAVGFFDVSIEQSELIATATEPVPLVSLHYRNGPHSMHAIVGLVFAADKYYALTWTDQSTGAATSAELRALASETLTSLSWTHPRTRLTRATCPASSQTLSIGTLVAVCVLGVSLVFVMVSAVRRRLGPRP